MRHAYPGENFLCSRAHAAVCIVLATAFLILALLCKVLEVHGASNTKKEDQP